MTGERERGKQLRLKGIEPSRHRLNRARTAWKRLPESEKSIVLEEVWSEHLGPAFMQSAQSWKDSRGAFHFREADEVEKIEYVSPEVADQVIDPDENLVSAIREAKRRNLFASTLRDKIRQQRIPLAHEMNDTIGWTRKYVSHVLELVGKVYLLQKSTIRDYQKRIYKPTKKLEPRLR
jgi:hypothetical protein